MVTTRGSEKLLSREAFTISQDDVDQIQTIVAKHEAKFVRWWVLGQPAPDVLVAGVHVKTPVEVGNIVAELLGTEIRAAKLEVFPYGLPYPDIYRINLRVGEGR